MHNQNKLNKWYETKPTVLDKSFNDSYVRSGSNLAEKVSDDEWVLDIGCGINRYKGKIKNLVGLDPSNKEADVHCSIEDYEPDRLFDVAFCLSAFNFGNEEVIAKQVDKMVSCLKPKARIYWRLSPESKDLTDENGEVFVTYYPWTFDKLREFAEKYGFEQTNEGNDLSPKIAVNRPVGHHRLYAEWHRNP